MKYFAPLRLATYLLVIYCVGHTFGGMLFPKSLGPAADTVLGAMKSVHFTFNGADTSYYGMFFGFGLMASVFQVFSAVTAWTLADVKPGEWRAVSPIAWALALSHVAGAVLSFRYFFAGPGILSIAIAVLVAVGALRKEEPRART